MNQIASPGLLRYLFGLCGCFLLSTFLVAQDGTYSVVATAYDKSSQKPIQDVHVYAFEVLKRGGYLLHLAKPSQVKVTSKSGVVSLRLTKGTEHLIVSRGMGVGPLSDSISFDEKRIRSEEFISFSIPFEKKDAKVIRVRFLDGQTKKVIKRGEVTIVNDQEKKIIQLPVLQGQVVLFPEMKEGAKLFAQARGYPYQPINLNNLVQKGNYQLQSTILLYPDRDSIDSVVDQLLNEPETEPDTISAVSNLEVVRIAPYPFAINSDEIIQPVDSLLEEIVLKLIDNPTLKVSIHGHMDTRGLDEYNLLLTKRQSLKIAQILISAGIEPERIKPLGFGETKPVNHCINGVLCSTEDHLRNRRIEIYFHKD
jgi:outer membrane protein OmpA-like peptidoglycan-associated protein